MKADRLHIPTLGQEVVVEVGVGTALADVDGHSNAVQDKVNFTTEMVHGSLNQVLKFLEARGVGTNDRRARLFSKSIDFAHAHRHGGIRKHELSALCVALFGDLPGNGVAVEGSEDDALFSGK